jgi:hypothetical protein
MVKHTFTGDTMTYFADNPNYSETQILFAIESFIIDIFSTGFKQAQLPVFKKLLEQFEPIYNIDYYYYDYISVFISLKLIIDQMRYDLNNEHPDNYEFVLGLDNEHLNYLEITAKSMRAKVQQDLHQFGLQEENNTKVLWSMLKTSSIITQSCLLFELTWVIPMKLRTMWILIASIDILKLCVIVYPIKIPFLKTFKVILGL